MCVCIKMTSMYWDTHIIDTCAVRFTRIIFVLNSEEKINNARQLHTNILKLRLNPTDCVKKNAKQLSFKYLHGNYQTNECHA